MNMPHPFPPVNTQSQKSFDIYFLPNQTFHLTFVPDYVISKVMTQTTPQIRPDHSAAQAGDESFVRVTKTKGVSEREFSKWVCKNWHSFVARVEAGLGGDPGNADLFLLTEHGMIPCELKTGRVKGGRLYSDEVRPAQIQWHSRLALEGGISFLLVHTSDGIFAVDACYLNQWENGYNITGQEADGAYMISNEASTFSASLESFIEGVLVG
jgi:hypothetical protein